MKIKRFVEWYKGYAIEETHENGFIYNIEQSNHELIRRLCGSTVESARLAIDALIAKNPEKELEQDCCRCNKPLDWSHATKSDKGYVCLDCYTSEIDRAEQ